MSFGVDGVSLPMGYIPRSGIVGPQRAVYVQLQ